MKSQLRNFVETLVPFLVLGIGVALLFALLIFFSYILIWGVVIGGIIGLVSWIRQQFFSTKEVKKTKGRVIEHDDID